MCSAGRASPRFPAARRPYRKNQKMSVLKRLAVFAFLLLIAPLAAGADEGLYPIKADDGTIISNHQVRPELESQIEKLPGVVIVGNPHGKVTLAEFYDLNCPYCRKAAGDIAALVRANPELRLVLVPFPVPWIDGIPSTGNGTSTSRSSGLARTSAAISPAA